MEQISSQLQHKVLVSANDLDRTWKREGLSQKRRKCLQAKIKPWNFSMVCESLVKHETTSFGQSMCTVLRHFQFLAHAVDRPIATAHVILHCQDITTNSIIWERNEFVEDAFVACWRGPKTKPLCYDIECAEEQPHTFLSSHTVSQHQGDHTLTTEQRTFFDVLGSFSSLTSAFISLSGKSTTVDNLMELPSRPPPLQRTSGPSRLVILTNNVGIGTFSPMDPEIIELRSDEAHPRPPSLFRGDSFQEWTQEDQETFLRYLGADSL